MRRGPAYLLLVPIAALVMSCLLDDDPDPQHRPIDFISLALPSRCAAGDSVAIEVSYLIGGGCWRVERLVLHVEAGEIRIEGTAINPNPSGPCPDVTWYGKTELTTPPLAAGDYIVLAGSLVETMAVTGDPTGPRDLFVYRGRLHPDSAGCALAWHSRLQIVLSGLPHDLQRDREYLLHGDIVQEVPCSFAEWPLYDIDYLVAVHHVLELE